MKKQVFSKVLFLSLLFILIGCFDDDSSPVSSEANHAPEIQSISADPDTISVEETTTLICTAYDEDGDTLLYYWSADGGSFQDQTAAETVTWAAPDETGDYIITVLVSDAIDSTSEDVTIVVVEAEMPTPVGMVLIPSKDASFQMGSENGFPDEQPIHQVSFTYDFWMDITEVTQADYDDLMSSNYDGYFTPNWSETYGNSDNHPAYELEWGDAVLYCNARSRRDGLDTVYTYSAINGTPGGLCDLENVVTDFSKNGYRLPTEAEWEFACRAGSESDFYWGKDLDPYPANDADSSEISDYAIWSGNSWSFGIDDTEHYGNHIVASKIPNGYGLYDMSGNISEWINDWQKAYSEGSVTDPKGDVSGNWHFVRGGNWGNNPIHLRSANRTFEAPDYYYAFVGFRVVRTVP